MESWLCSKTWLLLRNNPYIHILLGALPLSCGVDGDQILCSSTTPLAAAEGRTHVRSKLASAPMLRLGYNSAP